LVDTLKLSREVSIMPKSRPPNSPEFRRQMVNLVRAGRSPDDLAREFEPSSHGNTAGSIDQPCGGGDVLAMASRSSSALSTAPIRTAALDTQAQTMNPSTAPAEP